MFTSKETDELLAANLAEKMTDELMSLTHHSQKTCQALLLRHLSTSCDSAQSILNEAENRFISDLFHG